jgi:hypothetical protein
LNAPMMRYGCRFPICCAEAILIMFSMRDNLLSFTKGRLLKLVR